MVSDCTLHQVRGIPTAPGAAVRGLRFPQEDGEPQPPEGDQPQPVVTEGWCSEIAPPSASSTEVREPTTGAVASALTGALPTPTVQEDEESAASPRSLKDLRAVFGN